MTKRLAGGPAGHYHASMAIDILCKVVDNFGDIGVVWRLAKALRALNPAVDLRIIVDNLEAFAAIHPGIGIDRDNQIDPVARVFRWDAASPWLAEHPARLCVEAFACGRPDWYDAIWHDASNPTQRLHINLEYLSAEDYAAEFHLLPSLSPIPQVKKIFVMPGFSKGTAGLIWDASFMRAKTEWQASRAAGSLIQARKDLLARLPIINMDGLADFPYTGNWVSLFSYEHDFAPLVRDLALWQHEVSSGSCAVLVAAGRSAEPFLAAWASADRPFPVLPLPFLDQESWDEVILACDWNIVRGEESLARACLSGLPFLWQAYLQEAGHQSVKSDALLARLGGHFASEPAWADYVELARRFNQRLSDSPSQNGGEDYLAVLTKLGRLAPGFADFAKSLEKLGDCAAALLSLYKGIC